MSATLEANKPHELIDILEKFKSRHTWVKVTKRYQVGEKFFIEAEFRD